MFRLAVRRLAGCAVVLSLLVLVPGTARATLCGSANYPFPFTDVAGINETFCKGILESYVLGVTRGTSATTFGPNQLVDRTQMTTFLQRSIDQGLRRSSRRMALGQWWNSTSVAPLQKIALPGPGPVGFCKSDGERIWVGNGGRIQSVLARTGEIEADLDVGSLDGAHDLGGMLVANGRLVAIDPVSQKVTRIIPKAASPYGIFFTYPVAYAPNNLTYDGGRIWTANYTSGSIAIIPVVDGAPFVPGTVVTGFTAPIDVIYDGSNVWVAEAGGANRIRKLDANGAVLQTVPVGSGPAYMAFDGANLWVPNYSGASITVIQASSGAVVATIASDASNRLSSPLQAAFDGERILVTNTGNLSLTLFRAADMTLLGNVQLEANSNPIGACSDGINFWVTLRGAKQLLRL